jgi:zinc/manganese transport system substrate-binding protein/manganese/iron transport system substrate-binding protein
MAPGADPRGYRPSPADLDALSVADVLVSNGAGLESGLDSAVAAADFHGTRVVMADGVPLRAGSGADRTQHDPHIWHDPHNAMIMVTNIERGLEGADPARRSYYRANLMRYLAALGQLDARDAAEIATISQSRRLLVTDHDALGYYAARYHLTVVGAVNPSFDPGASQPATDQGDLVGRIRAAGATTVFCDAYQQAAEARAIGRAAGAQVVAGLYTESLGPAGSPADTYLRAEEHNTDVIVAALR